MLYALRVFYIATNQGDKALGEFMEQKTNTMLEMRDHGIELYAV